MYDIEDDDDNDNVWIISISNQLSFHQYYSSHPAVPRMVRLCCDPHFLAHGELDFYCGSCWAHATISALQDRIKIARKGEGHDINLSIQYLLNCGEGIAGSCHGGWHTGVYQLIQEKGFIPYET